MRILLALDGTDGSLGAARVGALLARRESAAVTVVTVAEPPPAYRVGGAAPHRGSREERDLVRAHMERVQTQLEAAGVQPGAWPVRLGIEAPGQFIIHAAEEVEADLIVLGLSRKHLHKRLLHGDVLGHVASRATVPVLAVDGSTDRLPRDACAGIDFSPPSLEAARAACDIVGPAGSVHLVHVAPLTDDTPDAARRLDELASRLAPGCAASSTILRAGDPAQALVSIAADRGLDLIAVGRHGRSIAARLILGSVSVSVLRTAPCSVLVAPPVV